jgi:hypothetical protein
MTVLSEERFAEIDDLRETFADLIFSVEVAKGIATVQLGVNRIDHRGKTPIKSAVPVARLVLPHKTVRELSKMLQGALDAMEKIHGDDDRVAITMKAKAN